MSSVFRDLTLFSSNLDSREKPPVCHTIPEISPEMFPKATISGRQTNLEHAVAPQVSSLPSCSGLRHRPCLHCKMILPKPWEPVAAWTKRSNNGQYVYAILVHLILVKAKRAMSLEI
jgi:hypothetical protein